MILIIKKNNLLSNIVKIGHISIYFILQFQYYFYYLDHHIVKKLINKQQINVIIDKLITDINELNPLFNNFNNFMYTADINTINKAIEIEKLAWKNECKIYLNYGDKKLPLYDSSKISFIVNNSNNIFLMKLYTSAFIINKHYISNNKKEMMAKLLSLNNDIEKFINSNNKYKFHTKCYTGTIIQYILQMCFNKNNDKIINNLSKNISNILLYFHLCEKEEGEVNDYIKKLFYRIKNDENSLLYKLYKLEIFLNVEYHFNIASQLLNRPTDKISIDSIEKINSSDSEKRN